MIKKSFLFAVVLLLMSCTHLPIEQLPSENYSKRIKFLVMHYTAINYQRSVKALVEKGYVSSHYLLPENDDDTYQGELKIYQLVDENDRAWHAGNSYWQGRQDLNDQSIGIEIVNIPKCKRLDTATEVEKDQENGDSRHCFFPDYDPEQIQLLIELSKDILARNPDIGPTQVIGHADITPTRKNDPGPRFPWYQLYKAGIGAWYEKQDVDELWQQFSQHLPNIGLVQSALNSYGYHIIETGILDNQTLDTLSAFQMHFLPWQVNGKVDAKTSATIFALLKKYFPERFSRLMQRYQQELTPEPTPELAFKRGQVDQTFPAVKRNKRALVNDRTTFKSHQGRGEIIIENIDALSADIFVNGQRLNIAAELKANTAYQYSLARRTKNGLNTLRVDNVQPAGASINIVIPYPELNTKQTNKALSKGFAKVDQLINQDIDNGFPGAVLLVIKDGKVIKHSAYGSARKYASGGVLLETPEKMTRDTLFDLASNTKMYATNFALMMLVEQGKLDVTKPVAHYLPEYQGGGREVRTVKDLLTHHAGYAPQVRFFSEDNRLGKRFFSQDKARTQQLILTQVPFAVGKQTKRMYSDTDFMLLGTLIERITGMPLDVYTERFIYQELGLNNILFNPLKKGRMKSEFAATEIDGTTRGCRFSYPNVREYVLQGEVHDEKAFYSMEGVAGHAGLFANASDLSVLLQTLLNGGGYGDKYFFSQKVLDQFTKPEENAGSYGLGWRRANHGDFKSFFGPYASSLAYGHTGWTGTVTLIDPAHDLGIILLTNARHTPIEGDERNYKFLGKDFETGNYGSVMSLIYEAVLNKDF
ncbi:penicillin binding protein PBP4B [Thalassotalea sp. G2M2-11]|uniref:penicillin binding protein PBP4B n=1 Tax=Thalassotalea sp. G2M2-11 TaxID=2787627 RepID=UPI0019D219B2|nr:penicillin binding protein PBP4B [Thalassotalea sp. G2M2-11]